MKKIRMALAGLGFGAEFIPIYQKHPNTSLVAICQRNPENLARIGDAFGIPKRYTNFEEMLQDPEIDAVHINTPIHLHASQTLAALRAGKHVACTVPMATTKEECEQIIRTCAETGKRYMMMETAVYTREFLFVRTMIQKGEIGRIQFLRGSHQQEMAGWPGYWEGLPPMHYATHAVGPLFALAGADPVSVSCYGSGHIDQQLQEKYGSPFAVESAHFALRGSDVACEATRSLFETAREYRESFDVYGTRASFEWQQLDNESPVVFHGEHAERVVIPDYDHLLPESIRPYTKKGVYDSEENRHLSFIQGSGHGGSHPHLAHEFISALLEDRPPYPDAVRSAFWTCAGICAHESAMNNGEMVHLPNFK